MNSDFFEQDQSQQVRELEEFSRLVLSEYGIQAQEISSINYEYNATFKIVSLDGKCFALRININSPRSIENIRGEIAWVNQLCDLGIVNVAKPVCNLAGEYVTTRFSPIVGKELNCVLFGWVHGEDVGDEPSAEQLYLVGKSMALMHIMSRDFVLPKGAVLPSFKDPFWETEDLLLSIKSQLKESDKSRIAAAFKKIGVTTDAMYRRENSLLIHADLHGWNLKWNAGLLSILDFDDCGFGLRIQDIATALYYLDTPDQDEALLSGYKSIAPLPIYSDEELRALLLHRRLMLLNYLYETDNQEHRAMIPTYLEETSKRIDKFLAI